MKLLNRFLLAASYVTTLPFLRKPESEAELFGLAKYLPAVGVLVGGILSALAFGITSFSHSPLITAALILSSWILITGAIHLDGLMDSADGLFSHRSRERMLEIMRDSRVGNYGVIAGVMLLLSKFSALASMDNKSMILSLLLIPAWARWTEVYTIARYTYAREEGMGKIWKISTRSYQLIPSSILPVIATGCAVFYGQSPLLLLLLPATIIPGALLAFWINAILKGHTGDTYGAVVEFSETSGLVAAALFFSSAATSLDVLRWWPG